MAQKERSRFPVCGPKPGICFLLPVSAVKELLELRIAFLCKLFLLELLVLVHDRNKYALSVISKFLRFLHDLRRPHRQRRHQL